MKQIFQNLYIGTDRDCSDGMAADYAIIHACKYPCHSKAVGYRGNLSKFHPNYLILEREKHLYLNMVDMEQELSPIYTNPIFKSALSFIDRHIKDDKIKILIHCNQGQSRSPSIGLVYLAKNGIISNASFKEAAMAFRDVYRDYIPGSGIAKYLSRNWAEIMCF
jgi:hypothetical protein